GDRFARGIGGALLFVCTAVLSFEIGEISILSGALILAWIFLVIRLRKEYSNSFRNALERRTIDIDQVRASLRESASLESLILSLRSKSPRQILFTLEFSSGITDDRLKEPLTELLAHHRNDVRAEALRQLAGFSDPALADVICPLAHDDDPTVRLEAIRYICGSIEPEGERGAKQLLQSDNLEFKASLYRCLLEEGETQQTPLRPDEIDEILADNTPKMAPVRRELASALAFAGPDNPLSAKFDRFLSDTDPVVLRRSIASAAHVKRRDLAPRLLELLSRSELRAAVIKALVEYGSVILGAMRDALVDPEKDFATRARLPRVIALIGGSEAAQTLTQQLALPDLSLRYNVIKALGTLRNRDSGVRFDEDFLREQLKNEAYESYIISAHLRALRSENKPGGAVTFLIRSLEDRRRIRLEQLFRLAGLIYPQDDMIRAFHGVISGSPGLRAGAIEFLDTMWTRPDKEMFFGMFESRGDALMSARRLLGIPSFKKEESIANLLDSSDVWLAACAANVAREEKLTAHREKLSALAQSQNQTLSETADRALSAIAP
ncbi:MAG: HEAT repeat domain-containing protein, partial [Candidatus Zixiibacteriota bacterium]